MSSQRYSVLDEIKKQQENEKELPKSSFAYDELRARSYPQPETPPPAEPYHPASNEPERPDIEAERQFSSRMGMNNSYSDVMEDRRNRLAVAMYHSDEKAIEEINQEYRDRGHTGHDIFEENMKAAQVPVHDWSEEKIASYEQRSASEVKDKDLEVSDREAGLQQFLKEREQESELEAGLDKDDDLTM